MNALSALGLTTMGSVGAGLVLMRGRALRLLRDRRCVAHD